MSDKIPPISGKDAEMLKTLERIAASLSRLADSAFAANCIREDSSRYLCETIASLHDLEPNKPKATKAKGRPW